ncbi:hypothetical protein [Pseudomonas putida]|uniref:Uncharacterized protein n=1 Tax=Pseudomonas putida TaxID=303 RepID=A0AAW5HGA1_PSEPU|nr:hypothetical protein [Pseudomonas putida]MCO1619827.1 hypothetical protein [Pseudomonas putida]
MKMITGHLPIDWARHLKWTGRAGKTQLNSAWRNGAKNTNQNGQQQKTTQEQRQLAHWNLYSCDAGMGILSSLG